jgi:4-oxalocrotonate tautomerase
MPLVRISLREGASAQYRQALADGVHQAMVEAIEIPAQDRFQTITEYPANGLIYDPSYLGIERSDKIVLVQITLSGGRKPAQKKNCTSAWRKSWRKIRDCARRICSST